MEKKDNKADDDEFEIVTLSKVGGEKKTQVAAEEEKKGDSEDYDITP